MDHGRGLKEGQNESLPLLPWHLYTAKKGKGTRR